MSLRMRWLTGVLGALLLIGAPTAWHLGQPAPSVGELPEAFVVEAPDDEVVDPTPQPEPQDAAPGPEGEPGESPAPEPVRERPAKPVSVALPAIGVDDAEVTEVGLDENRAVEIPDDVRQVGWYGKGPRPGEDGNAFMTSHIDSRSQGRGVLFDLRRSEPGDPVIVTHADGTTSEWEVVARERIEKGSYPMEQVFRFDGPPGLVIDTCGGAFDQATGHYESIDIIYAVPAASSADAADVEVAASAG